MVLFRILVHLWMCTIMRIARFLSSELKRILAQKTVCTFEELAQALGTEARMTVFRKLAELSYLTSYSHRGKYYALRSRCRFDPSGLWSYQGVWFSTYGTLLDTGEAFVNRAAAGYAASELDNALHVQTRQALLHLHHEGLIERERIDSAFIYLAVSPHEQQRQLDARRKIAQVPVGGVAQGVLAHEVKAAIILFFGLLDERQRRLFAGLESMKAGSGADARVAQVLGLDPHTVAKGRVELMGADFDPTRVRRAGGGRVAAEKKPRT
ncbi:MAG: hypothetical protein ACREVV_10725 [Steroidobacteraceae bacterium]